MITLRDIAKNVELSVTTVSYILNGDHKKMHISDKTAARVRGAAKRLGYQFDDIARAMVTGRAKVFGFISKNTRDEPAAAIIGGIMKKAAEIGYYVKHIYCDQNTSVDDLARQCEAQRLFGVIGYNLSGDFLLRFADKMEKSAIPLSLIGSTDVSGYFAHVKADDYKGGALGVKHLHSLGHRRIAHLSTNFVNQYARERRDGYLEKSRSFNLKTPRRYYFASETKEEKIDFLNKLFITNKNEKPTAITCHNDICASTVVTYLAKHGLRVPEDISVIGYGNFEISESLVPSLTTIKEPYAEMGAMTVELLLGRLTGEYLAKKIIFDVELVVRESTGIARG